MACARINCAAPYPFAPVTSAHYLNVGHSLTQLEGSILLLNGPFMVSALWTLPIEPAFYALIVAMPICRWINRTATRGTQAAGS
ncbi:hypothetical protein [Paraburkholderia xenovorans]|uniref:hypothetical protein n=1 Tax=Paraburkholderia xenovorans TaxID=36873 RepID=UPI0038BC3E88